MDQTIGPVTPVRAFWAVILICFGLAAMSSILVTYWSVLWTDVLLHNPHRTVSHALIALPLMSTLLGIALLVIFYFAALVAAASIAAILAANYGRVPFRPFLGALPVYAALIFAQDKLIQPFHWYTDLPVEIARYEADYSFYSMAAKLTVIFLPVLICSWWYLHRYELRSIREMSSESSLRGQP